MAKSDIINDIKVVLALSDSSERKNVAGALENAGFKDIEICKDSLELVLTSIKHDELVLITDTEEDILDLPSTLDYVSENSRYSTICVIADSWEEGLHDELTGAVDVFLARPVSARSMMPGITLDVARKRHLKELERDLGESEDSFAKDKNMGFAKRLIMDKLGLSEEGAGNYILSYGRKYGYDPDDVAKIIYEVLLTRDKNIS